MLSTTLRISSWMVVYLLRSSWRSTSPSGGLTRYLLSVLLSGSGKMLFPSSGVASLCSSISHWVRMKYERSGRSLEMKLVSNDITISKLADQEMIYSSKHISSSAIKVYHSKMHTPLSELIESQLGARFTGASITLHLDIDPEPEVYEIIKN